MTKYVTKENLAYNNSKIKEKFVAKRAGYDLSKNDLTDDLLKKIQESGKSDFDGDYESLENKPAIDGHELDADSTAAGLGLATTSDLPAAATTSKAGLVKPDGTTIKVLADGTISAEQQDLSPYLTEDDLEGYAEETWVTGQITAAKTELEGTMDTKINASEAKTNGAIDTKVGAAKEELQEEINSKMASAIRIKASVAFDALPALSSTSVGDMYNVTTEGTTDANWREGAGKKIDAGTNVVVVDDNSTKKWDAMSLAADLSGVVSKSDIEALTTTEIDEMWNEA